MITTVFLSYARGDDIEPFDPATSFVARLYRDLKAAGFDVWFDREDMPSRSLTFHQEIRDAIAARERLVLVVGPKAVTSDYVRQEWQFALREAEKVVTPILRLGDYALVPDELRLLHCEDFRDDAQYPLHLANLVRQLSEPAPPLGKLIAVPSLPAHYLARSDRLNGLRDALRADLDRPVVIGGAAAKVGVHGMGGIGKSVLASALAHDRKIREAFPDGVVWVGLGSLPELPALLRRVHRDLGGDGSFETEHEGKVRLKELLADRAVLLVLDDVWRRSDVDWFDVLGPRCRALITTRDTGLLTALGGVHHVVELLTDQEALDVLALAAGVPPEELPGEAWSVTAECGRLPLAVALCGGMIRRGLPWSSVLQQLKQARIDRIADRHAVEPQHQSVWHAIHVSVEFLPRDERERFLELAVFPPDATTPEAAIATLWAHSGKLADWESQELLVALAERSLVQLVTKASDHGQKPTRYVAIHDLVYDYIQSTVPVTPASHEQLLASYQAKCADGWPSGPNDSYFFTRLFHHLAWAGRGAERTDLLLDLRWLEAKAEAGYVFDLAMDFTRAVERLPADHLARRHLRLISQSLGADISFLARHPTTLFQCLWNRCWWYDCPEAAAHYDPPPGGWPADRPPCNRPGNDRLASLLEPWRAAKERRTPAFTWLRSLRPPPYPLGGAELACFRGHDHGVTSVAFDREGRRIVSGSRDDTVRVWDVDSGAELACLRGHKGMVFSVAFDLAGRRIVSGSIDDTVRVWDADSGAELACLRGHDKEVMRVAFDQEGRRIVSGSSDETVRVWDATTGAELTCLRGHDDAVTSVAFDQEGRRIVSGSSDETVRVWDATTGAELACLRGHDDGVTSVAFDQEGRRIVSGSLDNTARVWDADSGAELTCLRGCTGWVASVAFDREGERIVSGSEDGTVRVWDGDSGAELACLRGCTGWVTSVAFDREGERIVSGSEDGTVRVWDADASAELPCLCGHSDLITSLAFDPDGRRIVSGSFDNAVRVWDVDSGTELAGLRRQDDQAGSVAFDREGRRIVSGSLDNTARVWDADSGAELACLRGHDRCVWSVAFDREGRRIVSGSLDNTARVWDADSGAELACLRGHERCVRSVAFDREGWQIVSGSEDQTVRVWDADSGAELACLSGHTSVVTSVAFAREGRIVSGSYDNTVRVWDAATGECLVVIEGSGDVAAIEAAGTAFPWRALRRGQETVIEPASGYDPIGWFPAALWSITTHPSGRIWAGAVGNHLYLIRLEGDPDSIRTGGDS